MFCIGMESCEDIDMLSSLEECRSSVLQADAIILSVVLLSAYVLLLWVELILAAAGCVLNDLPVCALLAPGKFGGWHYRALLVLLPVLVLCCILCTLSIVQHLHVCCSLPYTGCLRMSKQAGMSMMSGKGTLGSPSLTTGCTP